MLQFGHTSLFVYWIHVELAYGVIASPLKGNLPVVIHADPLTVSHV
jgi:hypothetical protein